MEKKTIGVIGGMGPLATVDLLEKIVRHTDAARDQDHLRILVDCNTQVPDRTAAILEGGADPVPALVKSAKWLADGGAQCLVIPCNTSHWFHGQIQAAVDVPVLHMIELTCAALEERGVTCAALLATTGAVRTGLYQRACEKRGIRLLLPDDREQMSLMDLIYHGVKAGAERYDASGFSETVDRLLELGAQTAILGCTELPLAVERCALTFPAVDPTLELAKAAIRFAGGTVR